MSGTKADISKLPVWAQNMLRQKDAEIERLLQLEKAHNILFNRDWFTIQGPAYEHDLEYRYLWFLDRENPIRACSLSKGDILLIGKARPKK